MYQAPTGTSRDRILTAAAVSLASVGQTPGRSARRVSFAGLITAAGLLALFVSPASAAFGSHSFSTTFTGSGTNTLSNPNSVAVDDSTGDVYVTDPSDHRVEKFDPSGNFLLMFGKNVNSGTGNPNLCTNVGAPTDVCEPGTSTTSPGGFEELVYVAVDNSSGPSAGDVYVGDAEYPAAISKFDSSGHLISGWGTGGQLIGPPGEEWFTIYGGMTVDGGGNLYVYSYGQMFKFDQSGTWEETLSTPAPTEFAGLAVDAGENIYLVDSGNSVERHLPFPSFGLSGQPASQSPEARALAVESTTGDLYVDSGGTELQHYAATCSNGCTATESFGSGQLTGAKGVAVNPKSGVVYVANGGGHDVAVFTPQILADVAPRPVSDSGPMSITLNGEVGPAAGPGVTECYFEYGTAENSYTLGAVTCTPDPGESPPSSNFTTPTLVHAELSNLQPLTFYHYRLVAVNANGTTRGGDQVAITIPNIPTVEGTSSQEVTPNSAVLNAEINPGFGPTIYRFQYGLSNGYGSQTPPGPSVGSDDTGHLASAEIDGLLPGDTYHFRVLATNFTGTTFGPDQSFTTPSRPSVVTASVSAVARTSATLEATINPSLSPTTYHLDYGVSGAYGSGTSESAPIGADGNNHSTSVSVTGLQPGTTYHYRVVATNAVGTTFGVDQTFVTEKAEETGPQTTACARGLVKRHGRCVKKKHHKRKRRSHGHA